MLFAMRLFSTLEEHVMSPVWCGIARGTGSSLSCQPTDLGDAESAPAESMSHFLEAVLTINLDS